MPLTEYDNLTGEQKIKVTKMYADLSDLRAYLYDWDDKGYHGRRPKPKEEPVDADITQSIEFTPAAEKLAFEHGIDLADVEGTGVGGRILLADVEKHIE